MKKIYFYTLKSNIFCEKCIFALLVIKIAIPGKNAKTKLILT